MAEVMTWTAFAVYGILIAYMLSVIKYLVSQIFHIEEMKAISMMELQSLLFTLIIFGTLNAINFNTILDNANKTVGAIMMMAWKPTKGLRGQFRYYPSLHH